MPGQSDLNIYTFLSSLAFEKILAIISKISGSTRPSYLGTTEYAFCAILQGRTCQNIRLDIKTINPLHHYLSCKGRIYWIVNFGKYYLTKLLLLDSLLQEWSASLALPLLSSIRKIWTFSGGVGDGLILVIVGAVGADAKTNPKWFCGHRANGEFCHRGVCIVDVCRSLWPKTLLLLQVSICWSSLYADAN